MGFFSKKEPPMPDPKKSGKKLAKINKKLSKSDAKRLKKKEWARMKEEIADAGGSLYYPCGLNALVHNPDAHEQLCRGGCFS